MISQKMLITMYEYSFFLASQGIESLNHQESLVTPPGGGNSANWLLGHIITTRSNVLTILKIDPPWDYQRCKPYLPDSKPLSLGDKVENFNEMINTYEETQVPLLDVIKKMSEEQLMEIYGDNTLGEELAGYAIHEAFHAGELGILRHTLKSKK